ncbi:MAG TPA: UDP-N-acetylmuramate--L-alanine ligase [Bdellovibrionota bacterium]|jgi:UDP-N-acetylmuramate--alanine ligase|nr:UDP-N-acetylmuramate--L-alanine ligase [Bdellovibrionota bacterium]
MTAKPIFHLHFVGIGGIGMSGIAEVFLNQGFRVSGSDLSDSDNVKRLRAAGAQVFVGHAGSNVGKADVVVVSSAVKDTNPEVIEARKNRIPVIPRAEMLGELMRGKVGVAVAGTHGKTTTTSMMASVLTVAGMDPTVVIGGIVNSMGGNAKLGQGAYVVAEADESDGSFTHLPATYAIITNIDNDHMDHFGRLENLDRAFSSFVGKLPFYGMAAACGEDGGVRRCLEQWTKPYLTYGLSQEWDTYASDVEIRSDGSSYVVHCRERGGGKHKRLGKVDLKVMGRHNVLNSLAVVTVANAMSVPFEQIAAGLQEFSGVRRRFDLVWMDPVKTRCVVDDYGHHPTEIMATLAVARKFWHGRILTVFQPHRYSRTLHCKDGFMTCFHDTDALFMTDIYGAGEDPIPGVHARELTAEIQGRNALMGGKTKDVRYTGDLDATLEAVVDFMEEGDLVLFLGAGSITRLPYRLKELLESPKK